MYISMEDCTTQIESFYSLGFEVESRRFEPVSSGWQRETTDLLGLAPPTRNVWDGAQPSELPNRKPRMLLDVGKDGNCLGRQLMK